MWKPYRSAESSASTKEPEPPGDVAQSPDDVVSKMTDEERKRYEEEARRRNDMSLGENFADLSIRLNRIETTMVTKSDFSEFTNTITKLLKAPPPQKP